MGEGKGEAGVGKQSEKSKWMHQKSTNRKLSICRQSCSGAELPPSHHSHPHAVGLAIKAGHGGGDGGVGVAGIELRWRLLSARVEFN